MLGEVKSVRVEVKKQTWFRYCVNRAQLVEKEEEFRIIFFPLILILTIVIIIVNKTVNNQCINYI